MSLAKLEAQRDDAYRAIGRYVVAFSRLLFRMRFLMSVRLTIDHDPVELAELSFAGVMAQQITDSFFQMCRHQGNFGDGEGEVLNALWTEVNDAITARNRISHGDWWLEVLPGTDESEPVELVAHLIELRPKTRKGGFAERTPYPTNELDAKSDRLRELGDDLLDFGALALGLPVFVKQPGTEIITGEAKGEYGVEDVFTVAPSGEGVKARAVRDGPKASEVGRIVDNMPWLSAH